MYLETFKVRITNVNKTLDSMSSLLLLMYKQRPADFITLRANIREENNSFNSNKNLIWENDTTATIEWSKQFTDEGYNALTSLYSVEEIKSWMQSDQIEVLRYDLIEQ